MSLNFRINSKNGVRGSHSYCEKRHSSSTEIGLEAVRVAGLPSRWIDSRRLRCMAAHTNGHQVGFCSTHQDSAYCHVRSYTAIDQTRCDCTLWETGSRSCEALRGPFLAAVTVLESGLSNQNSIRMADRIRADFRAEAIGGYLFGLASLLLGRERFAVPVFCLVVARWAFRHVVNSAKRRAPIHARSPTR